MSLATANERAAAVHIALPWRGLLPIPDGAISPNDRAQAANHLGINLTPVITSTLILQKPVDYALAGQQDMPTRKGGALGRALRRIFNE
jgi:hypothetical protein